MHEIIDFIVQTVADWGYFGIFFMMLLESTFLPVPSEVVVIPAGYLAYQGKMNMGMIVLMGTLGSIAGACINYYLALFVGRRFLYRYGKYFLISPESLEKTEVFFRTHGRFSTFTGRLIPVVRHLISIPAGLAKMDMQHFILYTALGAAIWVFILAVLGYVLGQNEALIKEYLRTVIVVTLLLIALAAAGYVWWHKRSG